VASSNIVKMANRLRWGMWLVWAGILLVYAVGRLGVDLGAVRVASRADAGEDAAPMWMADVVVLLLTVSLYQLNRMLGALAAGDHFSARVIGSFRAFALWLLILALFSIAAPTVLALLSGPNPAGHYELKFQLHDLLTLGITLILFLVARLLERARAIDEEMREIV
jgi:hypothetical protein